MSRRYAACSTYRGWWVDKNIIKVEDKIDIHTV